VSRAAAGEYLVDRRLELDLPVPAGGAEADVADAAEVDGGLAGDAEKAVALEEGGNLAELAEIDETLGRAQAKEGFPAG